MFLDSVNIISDETFYTQSQIMVELFLFGNFFHHYLTLCVESILIYCQALLTVLRAVSEFMILTLVHRICGTVDQLQLSSIYTILPVIHW